MTTKRLRIPLLGKIYHRANTYINPVSRIMLNYTLADIDQVGKTNIGQVQFQIDF